MSIINCVGKRIKRTVALLIASTLLCSLTGCAKGPTGNNNLSSDIDSNNADETEFDIERVRKSFIIKGVPFELPKRIGDLDDEKRPGFSRAVCVYLQLQLLLHLKVSHFVSVVVVAFVLPTVMCPALQLLSA